MPKESNGAAAAPQTAVTATIAYESYVLRLRRVTEPAGERRQVWLQCIHGDEDHYFNSLRELTAYLRQRSPAAGEG